MERETQGLMEAMEFFDIKEGKIITLKQTETFIKEKYKIKVMAAADFLIM
jgi:uncharacterized protein